MPKKDLRNGKESGRWHPGKWSDARARHVRTSALSVAYQELSLEFGQYQASIQLATIYSIVDAEISRQAVHAAGLKTIGE